MNSRLETERLLLRPLTVEDAPAIFGYVSLAEVARLSGLPVATSTAAVQDQLRQRIADAQMGAYPVIYAILFKETNRLIGTIGFTRRLHETCLVIGYSLHPDYWGQGLMVEAGKAFVQEAFASLSIDTIELYTYAFNHQSRRIAEKLGFQQERLYPHDKKVDGHTVHIAQYALAREEWEKRNKEKA
ncbi:GNAT family N-acetyltransferase [Streptococcus moroccensis]|uniref:RimJ/RimL family protein N-acetyltransferase n=1 Tax=Streptococcus moroccensis TaxID=1451356 RepID=A0ABT9YNF5_9STRE|nr:GNAT family protein [Streptococcus moroccensis]MDQ0221529.1 RimJ/RimL family protein N-acetyltransferase [Streptococcus moroccensis]